MQYLHVDTTTNLSQLREKVGSANLESVLAVNSIPRIPNVGAKVAQRTRALMHSEVDVPLDYKINALNKSTQDSDIFESLALLDSNGWKVHQNIDALPYTLKMPDGVVLPFSSNVVGNGIPVDDLVYRKAINSLAANQEVDPSIFNTYASTKTPKIVSSIPSAKNNVWDFAKIPWGKMTIYSSIANESRDFPVYPEEISDNAKANYTTMPEIIYQYEPWQLYTSSGPRSTTYNFTFHRDMWTGDHGDGKANDLIRFCMANCYAEYKGSSVNTAYTTLYMNGDVLIRGILTDVQTQWSGPLGMRDNFYLVCRLSLTFIEVSPYPLDYWTMMNKPLIG